MPPSLDPFIAKTDELIERFGHSCVTVAGDSPDEVFAYTAGLSEAGWPELLVIGLGPQTSMTILNEVVAKLRSEERRPAHGMIVTEALNVPVHLRSVPAHLVLDYFKVSLNRANRKGIPDAQVEGIQIVWPDEAGKFPWDAGYNDHRFQQKVLGGASGSMH